MTIISKPGGGRVVVNERRNTMQNEYIEHGEIEIALTKRYDRITGRSPDFLAGYAYAYQVIEEDTTAADVRPVVRGEWIRHWDGKELECPACTTTFWNETQGPGPNFCPECGADMRGEEQR